MQTRWEGRNVNLELLAERIGEFFRERRFEAIRGKASTGFEILAENSHLFEMQGYVDVIIQGKPDDFAVTFELCGKKKRPFDSSPFLWRMFGGGYFILKDLKSEEAWLKLQQEFKPYLENAVLQLVNTAKPSNAPEE